MRLSVTRVGLAVCLAMLCSRNAPAQLAGVIPKRSVAERAATDRRSGPVTTAGITPALITDILLRFQQDQTKISPHVGTLIALLTKPPINADALVPVLDVIGIPADLQSAVTSILTTLSSTANSMPLKTALTSLFTNAATSVTHDRAIASTTVAELAFSRLNLRFVTATAISSAKEGEEDAPVAEGDAEDFRTRTADLLTVMQAGGNGVLRLYAPLSKSGVPSSRFYASAVIDAGVMGDWLNANSRSRFISGAVVEVTSLIRESEAGTDPGALFLSARVGSRWSNQGVVTGLPYDKIAFGQFLIELRIPGGKIPIGVSMNLVEKQFRKYTLPVHVYTNIGR